MIEDSLEESSKGFLKEFLKEFRKQSLKEISESKWNLKVLKKKILNESQKKIKTNNVRKKNKFKKFLIKFLE